MAYPNIITANGGAGNVQRISQDYISLVDLLDRPDFNPQMFQRYAQYKNLLTLMENMGSYRKVTTPDFYRFEKGYRRFAARIIAVGAGAGVLGDVFTITVANNKNANGSGLASPNDVDNLPQIQKSDTILIGSQVGYVFDAVPSGLDAMLLTIKPVADRILNQTHSKAKIGNYVSVIGNANSVDSKGGRQTHVSKPMMFKSSLQTFRYTFDVSNESLTRVLDIKTPEGKDNWTQAMWIDAMVEAENEIAYSLMFNRGYNENLTITDPVTGLGGVKLSDGLIDQIRTHGINYPKLKGSLFTIGEIDNINLAMDDQDSGSEVMLYAGNRRYNDIENALIDFASMTVNYETFNYQTTDAKAKCLHLGFNSWSKGNRSFHMNKQVMLNDPQKTNLPGMDFTDMFMIIPSNKVKDGSGNSVNTVGLVIRDQMSIDGKGGTVSRKNRQVLRDWSVNDKAADTQAIETFYEIGLECNLLHRAVLSEII